MRPWSPLLVLFAALVSACAAAPTPSTAPRATLYAPAPAAADVAGRWQQALDGEALYTIADGTKPVSCSFWSTWLDAAQPDFTEVAAVRAQLAQFCDEALWADVLVFHQVHDGKRAAQAYVADRAAVAALLAREAAFFAPHGLAPDTHPAVVFAVVERLPDLDRHRGMGLLFGYPQHAIDFFVQAQRDAVAGAKASPRRFVQIPTFGAEQGRFVYAVPPEHVDNAADLALRDRAAAILQRYRELRGAVAAGDLAAWQQLVGDLRGAFAGRRRD